LLETLTMPIFRGIEEGRAENGNQTRFLADLQKRVSHTKYADGFKILYGELFFANSI
jgi:hypothetical protein